MKSVMTHQFSKSPRANIQRSSFDRSHGHKTTFDAPGLIPIYVDEALPGDTFSMNAAFFARLNTPIVPILDNMFFETFFFEVPVRQIWENWEKFNGEQDNPGDSTDFLVPQTIAPAGGYAEMSLEDYMGIPPLIDGLPHSALFQRAYNHIWNTWFRDQNLQDSIPVPKGDGPDLPIDYKLQPRGKRHDYFTSSLPWPQKSDDGSVNIPLGTSAPVRSDGAPNSAVGIQDTLGATVNMATAGGAGDQVVIGATPVADPMYADLTEATAATINQLRQSIAIQQMFELDARGGTRYIEVIQNHWNVTSPDLRLQRPGYLGGGSTPINISPVAQTSQSFSTASSDTPQANLAAIGTVQASGHGFTRSFTEHTIIVGLCNVRADLTYQTGLNRMFSRRTRFDHYWPSLSTIGEQEVLQQEIWAETSLTNNAIVFGYQERFAEYRYKPSIITGLMRSSSPTSLDVWHLSQDFATAPVLNDTFIQEDPPIDRVIATPDEPQFKLDCYFQLKCARAMPMYGIPGLAKL